MKAAEEVIPSESSSKPIKKRVVDDDGARDDDNFEDYPSNRSSSGMHSGNSDVSGEGTLHEMKAKKDLYDFLENKGIDVSREMNGYRVHVQYSKNRRLPAGTFSVTYSGPDGDILTSKSDVLNAVKRGSSHSKLYIPRADIYAASQRKYEEFVEEEGLPVLIDDIRVLDFGRIDSDNSSFHSSVEIYPIGYRAEISIPAAPAVRGPNSTKSSKVMVL